MVAGSWNMCSKCWSLHQTTAAVSEPQMCANVQNVPNNQQLCKCRKRYFARKCWEDAVSFSVASKPQNPQNLWPQFAWRQTKELFAMHAASQLCLLCILWREVNLVQQLLWSLALKFRETCLHNLSPYPAAPAHMSKQMYDITLKIKKRARTHLEQFPVFEK